MLPVLESENEPRSSQAWGLCKRNVGVPHPHPQQFVWGCLTQQFPGEAPGWCQEGHSPEVGPERLVTFPGPSSPRNWPGPSSSPGFRGSWDPCRDHGWLSWGAPLCRGSCWTPPPGSPREGVQARGLLSSLSVSPAAPRVSGLVLGLPGLPG